MKRQKVCVVAPVHVWDDVRVFHKEACTLADAGYQVSLIANAPSAQTANGIDIIPRIGRSSNRLVRFLLLPAVGVQALLQNARIYHLHNPDTIPIAIFLRLFGKIVIYDTHEDFSKRILVRPWIPRPLRVPMAYCVGKAEALISKVVTASIATQHEVVERLGKNGLLLGNAPRIDEEIYARVNERAQSVADRVCDLRAIYIGRIEESRGLFDMVDALEIANKSEHVRLWLIGPATEADLDQAQGSPGWKYVDYMPRVEQELAFAYVTRADVGLVVMRDVGGYASIDPNKLYEYMMFGKPFIASAFDSWTSKLEEVDAGWFIEPGSANAIADALLNNAEDRDASKKKGINGRDFIKQYNWETESKKLMALYSEL